MSNSNNRVREESIRVRLSVDELAQIRFKADECGKRSLSAYMRECALGHQPRSRADYAAIEALTKATADLGRVGGLLKKWLTEDWRDAKGHNQDIKALLADIKRHQEAMVNASHILSQIDMK